MTKINEVPILYCNSGVENKEAYHSMLESKIPCEFAIPAEDPTPQIRIGFERYTGINEIKEFIKEWKSVNGNSR